MTCDEFQALAPALALGALDEEEHHTAAAHLREPTHRGCPESLARSQRTVALLAGALPPVEPGEAVWRAVAARAGIEGERRTGRIARRAGWVAAAAALLASALFLREREERRRGTEEVARVEAAASQRAREGAELLAEVRRLRPRVEEERELAALLQAPDSKVVRLAPVPGRRERASAVVSVRERRALVLSTSLSVVPGKDYQLWVMQGLVPKPAGFMRFVGGALARGVIDPSLLTTTPTALAVSLEPTGGRPSPSQIVMLAKFSG